MAGGLWFEGSRADKPVTTFTSAGYRDGGLESTVLALNNVFYHWCCVLVPPGFAEAVVGEPGWNPYGTAFPLRRRTPERGRPRGCPTRGPEGGHVHNVD